MTTPGGAAPPSLVDALGRLRAAALAVRYPLRVPSAPAAQEASDQLVARIDDYLVPRVSRRDAALLVIVGGPTGAGKSTLVNSLVRAPVSRTGVLRPTTRAPVLVCHPDDMPWFGERPLLPGLARTSGLAAQPDSLRLITAPGLPTGLALLDAPDVDSVVDSNRALAGRLLAAADLWLFVTTAARYADAVPWEVLRGARDRGTAVAVVLNRVPPGAEDEVGGDFGAMLDEQGLGHAHLFVLPEVPLDGQGLLAERLVGPLRAWLSGLAEDPAARADVIAQTMSGALAGTDHLLRRLAVAAEDQVAAAATLRQDVRDGYEAAVAVLTEALTEGALLRGEVLVRWRELVAEGRQPGGEFSAALGAALNSLIRELALEAVEWIRSAWQARAEGSALLAEVGPPGPLRGDVAGLVRDWESEVRALAGGRTATARVLLTLALLDGAPEVRQRLGVPRGVDAGAAGQARTALLDRVRALLAGEVEPYGTRVDALAIDPDAPARLQELARTIGEGPAVAQGRVA